MAKYRLTESNLRDIIREAVNETLMNEGNFSNSLKKIGKGIGNAARKGYKFAKEKYDEFGKDIEDLTREYDDNGNKIIDNPCYLGDDDEQTNESKLRGMIREAVKGILTENEEKLILQRHFYNRLVAADKLVREELIYSCMNFQDEMLDKWQELYGMINRELGDMYGEYGA